MNTATQTVTLKITSPCGAYAETSYPTMEEAQCNIKALRAAGSQVIIAGSVADNENSMAALRKQIGARRAAELDALYNPNNAARRAADRAAFARSVGLV